MGASLFGPDWGAGARPPLQHPNLQGSFGRAAARWVGGRAEWQLGPPKSGNAVCKAALTASPLQPGLHLPLGCSVNVPHVVDVNQQCNMPLVMGPHSDVLMEPGVALTQHHNVLRSPWTPSTTLVDGEEGTRGSGGTVHGAMQSATLQNK